LRGLWFEEKRQRNEAHDLSTLVNSPANHQKPLVHFVLDPILV
jgi:hypothetical protein